MSQWLNKRVTSIGDTYYDIDKFIPSGTVGKVIDFDYGAYLIEYEKPQICRAIRAFEEHMDKLWKLI